jgi:signal transduction histidine kinase
LANSMGMTLVLEKSEVGKGSTFSLTIPLFVA